jgi:preprotein translocase subunit SecD
MEHRKSSAGSCRHSQERGIPSGYRIVPLLRPGDGEAALLVRAEPVLDGGDLADAQPGFDDYSGDPVVNFRLSAEGTQKFAAFTTRNLDRRMAIVVDGRIVMAPWIRTPIAGGRGYINGAFTLDMAMQLAQRMRSDTCAGVGV